MSNERISHFLLFFLILLPYNLALALAVCFYMAPTVARGERLVLGFPSKSPAGGPTDNGSRPQFTTEKTTPLIIIFLPANFINLPSACRVASAECRQEGISFFFYPKKELRL